MIKMDELVLPGVMFLAYGGVILVYYRIRANERKTKVSNFMLKGTVSMRRGNLERALFYFNRAYEYSLDDENIADAADALYSMGNIYKESGDINTAIKCWENSDHLYTKINDVNGNKKIKNALKSFKRQ